MQIFWQRKMKKNGRKGRNSLIYSISMEMRKMKKNESAAKIGSANE